MCSDMSRLACTLLTLSGGRILARADYLITYYDRRDNSSYNFWYRIYATKLNSVGGRIGADTLVTSDYSNVANLRLDCSREPSLERPCPFGTGPATNIYTMGEYHDVWFWNGHWTLSYIFAPSSFPDDVYLSVVNP